MSITRWLGTCLTVSDGQTKFNITVRLREIGTGISEASTRVPIFPFATQGGKQAGSYFRERNWVQAREAQIRLLPAGGLEFDSIQ